MNSIGADLRSQFIEFLWRPQVLGRKVVRQVLQNFPSLQEFRAASPEEIFHRLASLGPKALAKILAAQRIPDLAPSFYPFFTQEESIYPQILRQLHDPPCLLYYRGDPGILQERGPWIGVVGTRYASRYALQVCRQILEGMGPYRPVVVSGMALGVDGMAHQSALDQGLKTVGVLGNCIDQVYPPEHFSLHRELEQKGLLISELPPGAMMAPWRFPERNRLIAALVDTLIVVEAPEKSGALSTAREALELGKEIFVVPGPFDSMKNVGGHKLIQDGANLLWNLEQLFKKYPREGSPPIPPQINSETGSGRISLTGLEAEIFRFFQREALHVDKIVDLSQLPAPQVSGILVRLTLHGYLRELPGKYFEIL